MNEICATHQFESEYARAALPQTEAYRNLIISESPSFVALPSIGSLVEGWLLIVPRDPAICMGALNHSQLDELTQFSTDLRKKLESRYGPTALFEHGPIHPKSTVGCGVDYAHLHLVPIGCNLREGSEKLLPSIVWRQIEKLDDLTSVHARNEPYLFLYQPELADEMLVATSPFDFPSQLFRRVIAGYLDKDDEFDWKAFPHTEKMKRTYEAFEPASLT